jgi:nucleoside-diphosphate-sugar epimerase
VDDLVRGLEAALFRPGTQGNVYNLGNPDERTVMEFASLIKEIAQSGSAIVHLESRPGEIAMRQPDITRATRELGWRPTVDLREGLIKTVHWARSQLLAPAAK